MTQHTPMHLELKGRQADGRAVLIDHDGGLIEVYGHGRGEIAAFIVQAVNSHDALVEALKFYADPSSHTLIHGELTSYSPVDVDEGYKARAALNLAGAA